MSESVLHVGGAAPYDVVVGRDLAARLPGLIGESAQRVAVIHSDALAEPVSAVLDESTRSALTGHQVVFLRVGLGDAAKRVGLGVSRPLLLGNVRGRIKSLLDERTPIYESVAAHCVETDGRTPAEVADEVRQVLSGVGQ